MAELKVRQYKSLPKNADYRAGYNQGVDDIAYAVRDFFEQKFINDPNRPETRDGDDTKFFLDSVRELSNFLRDEQKKAQERVRSQS